MKKKHLFILLSCVGYLLWSWIVATRIGLFELPDGFFYLVIAQFLTSGTLFTVLPYNAQVPQTLFGPIYGLITRPLFLTPYPWSMILIPLVQMIYIGIAGIIVYKLSRFFVSQRWSIVAVSIFFLLPFNFIYATSLMSESLTTMLFALMVYVSVLGLRKKKTLPWQIVFFVAAILTLTKNAYVFCLLFAVILPFWQILYLKKKRKLWLSGLLLIPVIMASLGLAYWLGFNYRYHGNLSFTNYTGRHLYNNVVFQGKFLPPRDSQVYQQFTKTMSDPAYVFSLPEWEVQQYFTPYFYSGELNEYGIDKLFLAFSLEAIKTHPFAWSKHVLTTVWGNITNPPYHRKILPYLGFTDQYYNDEPRNDCRFSWNPASCFGPDKTGSFYQFWGRWFIAQQRFYPTGMSILAFIALIGLISLILSKKWLSIIIGCFTLFFLLIPAIAQQIEGRYLLPMYPTLAVFIMVGFNIIIKGLDKIRKIITYNQLSETIIEADK